MTPRRSLALTSVSLTFLDLAEVRVGAQETYALATLVHELAAGRLGRGDEERPGLPYKGLLLSVVTEKLADQAQALVWSLQDLERGGPAAEVAS